MTEARSTTSLPLEAPAVGRRARIMEPPVAAVLLVAVLVAACVRIAPLVEGGARLQRQAITEDGYLMLTIARNLALGHGFSVAGGEVPTNGTQPLCTVIFAGFFAAAGGERLPGLFAAAALQVVLSIATAGFIYVAMRRTFYRGPHSAFVATLAAALWFASPSSVRHTQNGLETGLATLVILATVYAYDRMSAELFAHANVWRCTFLGTLCGLAFLARNDSCFLIAALIGVHLFRTLIRRIPVRGLLQSFIIGAISILVASPWLLFNSTRFGHIVPVSGRAEALHVSIAHNLRHAFVALLENLTVVLRLSAAMADKPAMQIGSAAALLVLAGAAFAARRLLAARLSAGIGILAVFVVALFVYYGFFFGQPTFLGRYFFPAVTLATLVLAPTIGPLLLTPRVSPPSRAAIIALACLACMAFDARVYRRGYDQGHFQAVNWVQEHVPDEVWVAAVQTGTLGFYHDRTLNLDGKVDPRAFEARRAGTIAEHVRNSSVEYIVDWASIAEWARRPEFAAEFELLLKDNTANLAVLQRKSRSTADAHAGEAAGDAAH
jgi:hypothetical protein